MIDYDLRSLPYAMARKQECTEQCIFRHNEWLNKPRRTCLRCTKSKVQLFRKNCRSLMKPFSGLINLNQKCRNSNRHLACCTSTWMKSDILHKYVQKDSSPRQFRHTSDKHYERLVTNQIHTCWFNSYKLPPKCHVVNRSKCINIRTKIL